MASYEIGLVYQKGSKYFIAVGEKSLVSYHGGVKLTIQPHSQYNTVRSISVEKLCEIWGIELEEFDLLMAEHLTPPQESLKTRPRGSRRKKTDDEDYWKRHRTGRIARPQL